MLGNHIVLETKNTDVIWRYALPGTYWEIEPARREESYLFSVCLSIAIYINTYRITDVINNRKTVQIYYNQYNVCIHFTFRLKLRNVMFRLQTVLFLLIIIRWLYSPLWALASKIFLHSYLSCAFHFQIHSPIPSISCTTSCNHFFPLLPRSYYMFMEISLTFFPFAFSLCQLTN